MNSNEMDLATIPLRHLFKYLTSRSWIPLDLLQLTDITIMRKMFGVQEEEIIVPRNQIFADFRERISDIVHALSRFENRTVEDILGELWSIGSDVLRIRISGNSVGNGKAVQFVRDHFDTGYLPKHYFEELLLHYLDSFFSPSTVIPLISVVFFHTVLLRSILLSKPLRKSMERVDFAPL